MTIVYHGSCIALWNTEQEVAHFLGIVGSAEATR